MTTLQQHAQRLNVSITSQFFPANSMGLLFHLILEYYVPQDQEIQKKLTSLLQYANELLSSVVDAPVNFTTQKKLFSDPASPLVKIYAVVDTPVLKQVLTRLIYHDNPLQDALFIQLNKHLSDDEILSASDFKLLLQNRALDAVVLSVLLGELISVSAKNLTEKDLLHSTLLWQLYRVSQMNDLVDCILHAKSDFSKKLFSPIRLVQKITPNPQDAKQLVTETMHSLQEEMKILSFPKELQNTVNLFTAELAGLIIKNSANPAN